MSIIPPGGTQHPNATAGEITAGSSNDENRSTTVDQIVELIVNHTPGAGGGDFTIASRSSDISETLTIALANTITLTDAGALTITKTLPVGSAAIDGKVYGFQLEAVAGGQLDVVAQGTDRIVSGGGLVTTYTMSAQHDFVVVLYEHQNARFNIFSSSAAGGAVSSLSSVPQDRLVGRISTGTGASENLTAAQVFSILGVTAYAQTLLDDVDASTAQTTLGISTFIKTLIDDVDAATARGTLGVDAAGFVSDVAQDRILGRISVGSGLSEELTAAQVFSILGVTAYAQTLLDDVDAPAARTTLGALGNVVEDTTPQLGGDLDTNGNKVTGGLHVGGPHKSDEGTITGVDIECNTGTFFYRAMSADFTPTLSSIPASPAWYTLRLRVAYTSGVLTLTGFTGLTYDGGSAPTLVTGHTYDFDFTTRNGGTNWTMCVAGDYS